MRASFIAILACVALASCNFTASNGSETETPEPAPVTLSASGEPRAEQALDASDTLEWAASVVRVDYLANQQNTADGHLFGLAGGDPAMNGLRTHLAFFRGPAEPSRVFSIGDFLDYRVLSDDPGRIDLEINESTLNNDTGEIGSQTRHIIVTWTANADGAAPDAIQITPATAR